MTNRISSYYDGASTCDLKRAQETMAFCRALIRMGEPRQFASWELDTISALQTGAASVFRKYGLPVPWLASKHG